MQQQKSPQIEVGQGNPTRGKESQEDAKESEIPVLTVRNSAKKYQANSYITYVEIWVTHSHLQQQR